MTGTPGPQAMPLDRAILWRPAAGGSPRAREPYPVFIVPGVLDALHDHAQATPKHGVLGFLAGDLNRDTSTGAQYLVVDSTIRLNQAIYGDRTNAVIAKLLDRVQGELSKVGGHLLGWYHSHPPQGVALAPGDVEAHLLYFTKPWHFALVLGVDDSGPAAAFYRPTQDAASAETSLPFYEIAEPVTADGQPAKRSVIPWTNFVTEDPVVFGSEEAAEPAGGSGGSATPAPQRGTLQILGREGAAPPQRAGGITTSDIASDLASPTPPPAPPPAPSAPPPRPSALSDLPLLHVEPPVESPPPRTAPPPPASSAPRPAPPPAPPAPPPRPPSPARRPASRVEAPRRPPAVRRGVVRPRRRRWPIALFVVILAVGLAAAAWRLGYVRLPKVRLPIGGAGTAGAAPADAALLRLDALADSLSRALVTYRERAGRFDGRRATCADLQRILVAVEDGWIAYNARGRAPVRVLDVTRERRDEALYAGVDSVDRHFERSGCARP